MEQSKWINERTACEWLGVSRQWLIRNRDTLGINYSYLKGQRVLMYDRTSIERALERNGTEQLIQKQTSI